VASTATRNQLLTGSETTNGKSQLILVSLDWVLSHWVHFTVHSLDLVVFICVYFVLLFFILHICCVIVSTVGWA